MTGVVKQFRPLLERTEKKVLQKGKKVAGKDFFSTGIGTKKVELPTYRADGSEKM